jgi:hypothetical protein
VRLGGTIIEGSDKHVASRRTVLWMADAGRELRRFACWCVRNTPLHDGRVVWDLLTDERSRAAVEVAERYADGLATDDELLSAVESAWVAVESAGVAAESAAWCSLASPSVAAVLAALAARKAVRSVARAATRVARSAQNAQLEIILSALGGDK